ncbi:MAG: family 78 glycoside hydrolase catalytic domain [Clostridia bacterium]|nr:family 78 glycoside hydrolase catalytic domain [Clostridia bacterium]
MIKNLKCDYLVQPVGIDSDKPHFSWTIEDESNLVEQIQYRIKVCYNSDIVWDSGYVESNREVAIEYNGDPLKSLKKYDFSVNLKLSDGRELSEKSFFVTGLFNNKDKNASWITHPNGHDNPIFYKDIIIKGDIKSAYMVISGLGYYECTINDTKAHDTLLVPAFTDYMERNLSNLNYPYVNDSDKRILYNTYDVRESFKKGSNSLKVMLGNGWFGQNERNIEGDMMYGCPRLFLKIAIEYKNGEKQEILSDDSFFVTEGPYEFNNIFFGEIYNDNIGRDFSYQYHAEVIEDDMGELHSQITGADRAIELIKPIRRSEHIYEVEKNMTGWVRFTARGVRGAKINIKFFEKLSDDMTPDFYSTGGDWQIQQDTCIFHNEELITYEPKFTWHGFKYFYIEKDDDIEIIELNAVKVHSDLKVKSTVKTDNELINWLYDTYVNTQLCNYHGLVPSDCPHRERAGYTGDGHITVDAALYSLDSYYLYKKWNTDIIYSQHKESGFIPHTVPFIGGGGGPAWGMAVAIVPYTAYLHTFDKRILEDSYEAIKNWVEYLRKKSNKLIIDKEEEGSWCLGEWCIPVEGYQVESVVLKNIFDALDPRLVNTCYFYHCVEILETVSTILNDDCSAYSKLKEEIRNAINDKFLDSKTGKYYKGEYGANIYPLYFNIVPEKHKDKVLDSLEKDIIKNQYKTKTGIFATAMLPKVLIENNREAVFVKMLKNNEYPSFGYMKENNATTLWETWDGNSSINHPMFGGIVSFIFKYIAGIKYINASNEIIIQPEFNIGINHCHIEYESIYGNISVYWSKSDQHIDIEIKSPGNVKIVFVHKEDYMVLKHTLNKFTIKE